MKRINTILVFILIFFVFLSCSSKTGKKHSDPSGTYSIYIPSNLKPDQRYPLLLAFDPHANGSLPVNKYNALAERYGFILAGSNISKNGQSSEMTGNTFLSLMAGIRSVYPIDTNHVYLMGFSGGARVAGLMALSHPGIRGVIACGAGLPMMDPMPEIHFEYYGIAGLGDFNLNELLQLNDILNQTRNRHFITTFEGPHEWPPLETMEDAILWINMKGEPGLSRPEKKLLELEKNPEYKKQQKYRKEVLKKEESEQQKLMGSLFPKDLKWWKETILEFESGAKQGKDQEIVWMNQRLLAFLSLFCYSNANAAMNQDKRELAEKVIKIYGMSDPKNPEPDYLQALLFMRNDDTTASIAALKRAIDKGFSDKSRTMQQREFEDLKSNRRFFDLLQKMK